MAGFKKQAKSSGPKSYGFKKNTSASIPRAKPGPKPKPATPSRGASVPKAKPGPKPKARSGPSKSASRPPKRSR